MVGSPTFQIRRKTNRMCYPPDDKSMSRQTDVMIIGSGCAAWLLALFLRLLGISCAILDVGLAGAFASTGNQGWLQAGGLFLLTCYDFVTARACQQGYRWITNLYPAVIRRHIPCYFLLPAEQDPSQALALCKQVDARASLVDLADLHFQEPILGQQRRGWALQTSDIPVDTHKFLQIVAGQVCQMGGQFKTVPDFEALWPVWDGSWWRVALDQGQEIRSRAVVLACGAALPEMLQRCIPGAAPVF